MDWTSLVTFLAVITLGAGVVVALISQRKTEQRMANPDAPKSTLAKDAPSDKKPADV